MESHLLQMRGLKLLFHLLMSLVRVASFTDAWIETLGSQAGLATCFVASFTDAWIETDAGGEDVLTPLSHLLQMRGLKPPKLSNGYKFF